MAEKKTVVPELGWYARGAHKTAQVKAGTAKADPTNCRWCSRKLVRLTGGALLCPLHDAP